MLLISYENQINKRQEYFRNFLITWKHSLRRIEYTRKYRYQITKLFRYVNGNT